MYAKVEQPNWYCVPGQFTGHGISNLGEYTSMLLPEDYEYDYTAKSIDVVFKYPGKFLVKALSKHYHPVFKFKFGGEFYYGVSKDFLMMSAEALGMYMERCCGVFVKYEHGEITDLAYVRLDGTLLDPNPRFKSYDDLLKADIVCQASHEECKFQLEYVEHLPY